MAITTVAAYIGYTSAANYFSNKLFATAWNNAGSVSASQALIEAANNIDTLQFNGYKVTQTGAQYREFPRYMVGGGHDLPSTGASTVIVEASDSYLQIANCEQAFFLLEGNGQRDNRAMLQRAGVKSITIANTSESYGGNISSSSVCPEAMKWLDGYLIKIVDASESDILNSDPNYVGGCTYGRRII